MTKQKKTKPKGKTPAAKLPTMRELRRYQPEGRGITDESPHTPKKPTGKQLHPKVLLCVPYFVCQILTDIHKDLQPEYYDGLKQTAREEVQRYYDNVIKTIKPFKKKDGFDFVREYRKWLDELKKLFDHFLNQDLDFNSWRDRTHRTSKDIYRCLHGSYNVPPLDGRESRNNNTTTGWRVF